MFAVLVERRAIIYDAAIEPDGAYYERCRACDWNNHPGYGVDDGEAKAGDE